MNKDMNKVFGEFGLVSGIHMSHLGIAIKNAAGNYVSYDKTKDEIVDVDLIDFDADNMVYAMPTAIKMIKKGDIIRHVSGNPVFVTSVEDGIHVIDVVNSEKKEIVPPKSLFGFDYVIQIIPLIDFSGSNASEDNPFGNLLLPLMFSKNKDNFSMRKNLIPMMILAQAQKSQNQEEKEEKDKTLFGNFFNMSNPFIWMTLMSDEEGGSDDKDFFQMMLLTTMVDSGMK